MQFSVRAVLDLRSSGERQGLAARGFYYSKHDPLRPSSSDGLGGGWGQGGIDPGRSGPLISFTEPSLYVWKSDTMSRDGEKGLHAWTIATGEENPVRWHWACQGSFFTWPPCH